MNRKVTSEVRLLEWSFSYLGPNRLNGWAVVKQPQICWGEMDKSTTLARQGTSGQLVQISDVEDSHAGRRVRRLSRSMTNNPRRKLEHRWKRMILDQKSVSKFTKLLPC